MFWTYTRAVCLGLVALLSAFAFEARGQLTGDPEELTDVSYIYSAVMGSGTYKIGDRRISMLRAPFAWTQRPMTNDQAGIKWTLPVTVGYDALNYPDWLDRFLEDELVTLTVLPGFEVQQRYNDSWVFKPFGNLGAAYDFSRDTPILLGVLGIRMLGTWMYGKASEFRVGTSARLAGEYQPESGHSLGFSMFEAGLDYRRDTYIKLLSRKTNAGVYTRSQLFLPEWGLHEHPNASEEDVALAHEVGVSAGLQRPFKILGIPISRVRVGYKFGDNVSGWTIGTEFPF